MFIGLSNSYNNPEKFEKNKNNIINIDEQKLNLFNFVQPISAQLISSTIGQDDEILLRYLYKGNNVLVILNSKTMKIRSIITIKTGSQFGVN